MRTRGCEGGCILGHAHVGKRGWRQQKPVVLGAHRAETYRGRAVFAMQFDASKRLIHIAAGLEWQQQDPPMGLRRALRTGAFKTDVQLARLIEKRIDARSKALALGRFDKG